MPKPRKNEPVQCVYFRWKLYRRKGTWYADGRSNDPPCGRHSLDTTSEEEARRSLVDLDYNLAVQHGLAAPRLNSHPPGESLAIVDGIELYLAEIRSRQLTERLSANSVQRYGSVAKNFLAFCAARRRTYWHQVDVALVREYVAWLNDKDRASNTQYLEVTFVKQCVNFLIREKCLSEAHRIQLKMHRPEDSDRYCYTPAEVTAMLGRCASIPSLVWLGQVITGLVTTGMRIGELESLRWSDFDFDRNMIHLTDERHSATRRRQGTVRRLKGKRNRAIPICDELLALLPTLPRYPDGKVFRGPDGKPIGRVLVLKTLKQQVLEPLANDFPTAPGAAAGLRDGCLHSFRHYFCSVSADAGVSEQTLMSWLGHRESKLIRRYYHLHDDASQQSMKKIVFVPAGTGVETASQAS